MKDLTAGVDTPPLADEICNKVNLQQDRRFYGYVVLSSRILGDFPSFVFQISVILFVIPSFRISRDFPPFQDSIFYDFRGSSAVLSFCHSIISLLVMSFIENPAGYMIEIDTTYLLIKPYC